MFRFIQIGGELINLGHITKINFIKKDNGTYWFAFIDFKGEEHYLDVEANEVNNLLHQLTK